MSRYDHIVKFNGKYYAAGEEVPGNTQSPKLPDVPQSKRKPRKRRRRNSRSRQYKL